jgi:hypothetical protein
LAEAEVVLEATLVRETEAMQKMVGLAEVRARIVEDNKVQQLLEPQDKDLAEEPQL